MLTAVRPRASDPWRCSPWGRTAQPALLLGQALAGGPPSSPAHHNPRASAGSARRARPHPPLTVGQVVLLGVAAEPADGEVGGLLHDVPQLARQRQLPFAVHPTGLHEHDLPA